MRWMMFFMVLSGAVYVLELSHQSVPDEEIVLRDKKPSKKSVVLRWSRRSEKNPGKRKYSTPDLGAVQRVHVTRSQTHERPKSTVPLVSAALTPPIKRPGVMVIDNYKVPLGSPKKYFEGGNFSHSTFVFCECSGLSFQGAGLCRAVFCHANLMNSDFSGADLKDAQFSGARLVNVNFTNATIEGALFDGADMRNAHIVGEHGTIRLIDKNYLDAKKAECDEHTKFGLFID